MILVDANLLLYAHHPRSDQHQASRAWLEGVLSGSEFVRFAWLTPWAFLRISTNSRVFEHPLSIPEAEEAVASLLAQPSAGIFDPGDRHWDILRGMMRTGQTVGPLVMDAVLAAIATEHGATLHRTDRDFSRFAGLHWRNPLLPD